MIVDTLLKDIVGAHSDSTCSQSWVVQRFYWLLHKGVTPIMYFSSRCDRLPDKRAGEMTQGWRALAPPP